MKYSNEFRGKRRQELMMKLKREMFHRNEKDEEEEKKCQSNREHNAYIK